MKNSITLIKNFKQELKIYRLILEDERTPFIGKIILGLSIVYLFSPIDLIPDFIPILGQLDDLIIVPFLIFIAIKLIPKNLLQEYREKIIE